MELDTAKKVSIMLREVSAQLDASIRLVMENCEHEEFIRYRRIVGKLMGEIFVEILDPMYAKYPELMPEHLRKGTKIP